MGSIDIIRTYDARPGGPKHAAVRTVANGGGPAVFLVDRIWPRGIAKTDLPHNVWLRDLAPSTKLRTWFKHDPERFAEFERRYMAELDENVDTARELISAAKQRNIILLYSAKDERHNQAVVLRRWLLERGI